MANRPIEMSPSSVLDRTIDLSAIPWSAIVWVAAAVAAAGLRFAQLDHLALSPDEAHRSYDAWIFFRGASADPGQEIANTSPVVLLLQSFAFFLFGTTDVTARVVPALLGVGLVLLTAGLRSFVGTAATVGMAALAAVSPTLLYASRTADPPIAIACFSLLFVVCFLRAGLPDRTEASRRTSALAAGVALALMFGSGPASITVMITLAVGIAVGLAADGSDGALRRALDALVGAGPASLAFLAGFIVATVALFSRFFSDLTALAGIGESVADWGRLMTTETSATPTQFFVLSLLLYEIAAIAFAVAAASRGETGQTGRLSWVFFAGWFVGALLLFSFASGRAPEHAGHVALPLVLLGGGAIGDVIAALDRRDLFHGRGGALLVALLGLVISGIALLVLIGRLDTAIDESRATVEAILVGALVVIPLLFAVVVLANRDRLAGTPEHAGLIALTVLLAFLGAYTIRSSMLLNFANAGDGTELLAQQTSTPAVRPLVDRLKRLSRDVTVTQPTIENPTGGQGISIAIDRRVQWPYRWYFREFPNASVAPEGQAALEDARVVIAPDDAGMAEAGYTPATYYAVNRVPGAYLAPSIGDIVTDVVVPTNWDTGLRYLLYRELTTAADPEPIAVGLSGELANRVYPNTGPFNLFERVGPGSGRGQFNQPRGVAVGAEGVVYVVDMGNARLERFGASGEFVGIWGAETGGPTFTTTQSSLGPTGIAVGPDELIYVADTWGHRIVVLDQAGTMVREFGSFGDTEDATTADVQPGLFFGPRAVTVTAEEIYVVDTGNERVQVFGMDGTFRRAWGGFGSAPEQFIEPVGIALGPDGRVFVADSGNGRISVFSTTGTPLQQWNVEAWAGRQFFEPYLAFGPDGNLYATSSQTGSVEVFTSDGAYLLSVQQVTGETMEAPIGIAAAPDGSMLIGDGNRSAVFRYQLPELPEEPSADVAIPAASPAASPVASPVATPVASPAASPAP
ncbi:MAG: hypothetical protein ACRDJW_12285 [Thermomicrobiales bacterium]